MYDLETDKEAYYFLGKIIKTHGYKGELVILLDSDKPEAYSKLKMFFIDMDGSLVPWFLENIRIRNELATVKIQDISDAEQAKAFLKKDIYLPVDDLAKLDDKDFYFHEIIGFEVIDKNYGQIGRVEEVFDRPEQEILRIMKGKKEILIPLTDHFITRVDRKKKELYLNTPPGLIDIYLV